MAKNYDVVVVGGGPGGSTCAALLGKAGKTVVLLEKARFPRDKTCGDAISGSLRVQKSLNIIEKLKEQTHAEINGVEFSSPEGVILDIPFASPGFCCKRFIYDNIVFQEALNNADAMMKIIKENAIFKQRFEVAELQPGSLKGWRLPVGSKRRTMHGDGFVLVGDAAALIDPFTGEGIANSMVSGEIAAEWAIKALEAGNFSGEFLQGYEDAEWQELGAKMKASYRLQKIGNIKFLTNMIIKKAARSEQIRNSLKSMVEDIEHRNNIINPAFYLKLLLA